MKTYRPQQFEKWSGIIGITAQVPGTIHVVSMAKNLELLFANGGFTMCESLLEEYYGNAEACGTTADLLSAIQKYSPSLFGYIMNEATQHF